MSPRRLLRVRRLTSLLAAGRTKGAAAAALLALSVLSAPMLANTAAAAAMPGDAAAAIVAVVNGDIVSQTDVINRRRLFALSTGLPMSEDVLLRLTPQIKHQLIDERLRLQEVQRRRILVSDQDIAKAVQDVEQRNGMPPGTLRKRLSADNVSYRTLVDQVRVQIGWSRVLHQVLGSQDPISESDIVERENALKAQIGQTEYRVGQIFIPADNPAAIEAAQRFADTVIQQLHAGAPFPVVAAQFSQSQTALQGGDLGWVQQANLDPAELRVLSVMPVGAVSNPLRVPGGLSIVALHDKREVGNDPATMLKVRQAFYKFTSRLDSANPTEQQKQSLEQARKLSAGAKTCDDMDAANKAAGTVRPNDPGELRLEALQPALRKVLERLPDGHASQPLVAEDGILVVMVCSREHRNMGLPSKREIGEQLQNERIELASRQLLRDLQRRASIDERS